jgi:DNA end-binding protein Ku
MAPRSSWKGFLKLSLITVPVKAFTANNTTETLRLNQLHKDCHSRVRYQKVCPEHGELKQSEIVSGYEYAKDQYVVIEGDELNKLRPESDHAVRIDGFVGKDAVDPIYYAGRTYYLMPDGVAGGKAYALLHQGMVDAGVHAIAQVVIAGREQLVLVRPIDRLLSMTVLTIEKKVKSVDEFTRELGDDETSPEEMALANTLIQASTIKEFDFGKYEDAYNEKLTELIQLKVDGKEIVQAPDHEEPKIINLMEALKASVAAAQSSSGRKMAPSVKEAAEKKATRRKKSG